MTDGTDIPPHRVAAARALLGELDAQGARTVALCTHVGADGDGCGSEVALALLLKARGIDAWIVNPTPWPPLFQFLLGDPGAEAVADRSAEGEAAIRAADRVIVLDISDVQRLGALGAAVRAHPFRALVVDHHQPGREPPGDVALADVTACATGELVYDLAMVMGATITPQVATALYAAILTDTGGFRFSNTSPRCHAVASALLRAGVDPAEMYRRIYASQPLGRLRLLRDALDSLEVDEAAGLAWLDIAAGALEKYELTTDDLDGVAEFARSVRGTRVALLFRDLGNGSVKVSFRSTDADVNVLARQFGGGGHARASGALIHGSLATVRAKVLAAARAQLAAV